VSKFETFPEKSGCMVALGQITKYIFHYSLTGIHSRGVHRIRFLVEQDVAKLSGSDRISNFSEKRIKI